MIVFKKKGFWAAAVALCAVLSASQLSIAAGYQEKILCSAVFVSKRDPKTVLREDVAIHPLMHFIRPRIDRDKKDVVSSTLGLFKARAIYS